MPMNWYKVRIEFDGDPATHMTFYRPYPMKVWINNIFGDLSTEFGGSKYIEISFVGAQ